MNYVPSIILIFLDRLRSSWLDDLPKYQTLFGALIFAASLASIGVALRNWNQRMISARQLAAERREEDLALGLKKQQIASAFIGEIDSNLGMAESKSPKGY
jgi:hypothetical protein